MNPQDRQKCFGVEFSIFLKVLYHTSSVIGQLQDDS